ncbi:MAG: FlgO family outer membrane protein [Bacteroidota bacterium]
MSSNNDSIRLLAAIMFADMVGYSKIMQEDEQKAKLLRDRQRNVVDTCILDFRGQVMQYYGDGTLSMFGSALDAVSCAKEIQKRLSQDPVVPLRIGIHVGDVVYDSEGIYGDAVNIAARVQSLATPGGVMLSGKVFDEVKNHPGIRVESFGNHELKNILQPVSIYALANEGLAVPDQDLIRNITGSNKNSVAVLPFVNFSGAQEHEYFSDGITEEIINALVKVEGLKVTSRTSAFAFKNTNKDIKEIAKELNVAAVLEGSIRLAGDRVRVTAQLIDADDGFHIWSENYDREMKDIFAVQDEISQKIAAQLEESFTVDNSRRLYEASTDSVDAYNFYLQGLFYWNKFTPESARKSIEYFQKAVEVCSTYTDAYSGLANAHTFLGAIGHMRGEEAYPIASEYAQKAIQLNDHNAKSYVALGLVELFHHWDFSAAETRFRKAITLEPDLVEARTAYGLYHRVVMNYEKMVNQYETAVRIDPLSLPALLDLGKSYWLVGRYDEALEKFEKVLELDPSFRAALEAKALVYVSLGDLRQAESITMQYVDQIIGPLQGNTQLGFIEALRGNVEGALMHLQQLEQRAAENPTIDLTMDFSIIYVALEQYEKALDYLEKAYVHRLGSILFINSIPYLDKLKKTKRYQRIVTNIGLPNTVLIA